MVGLERAVVEGLRAVVEAARAVVGGVVARPDGCWDGGMVAAINWNSWITAGVNFLP